MEKVAAIYARKSLATDKGESTENQIQRGKDLCNFKGWTFKVYEDYDVSGKNLDRPRFKDLMRDIESGMVHTLICYKLDRVSRSVNDFSTLIEDLDKRGVDFVSLKENFDTSTPMGRAMMMITSVFAQLERETIAERVRDNMIDRAKLGKWNGGAIPFGFDSISEVTHVNNKTKKTTRLVINEDEATIVRLIFEKYRSSKSIRNSAHELNRLGYKTKKGANWNPNQVHRILKNAIYCIGDTHAYNYFNSSTEVQISSPESMFTDKQGLMYYNRRKPTGTTSKQLPESDWILSVAEHQGIIPGKEFVAVQKLIKRNAGTPPREGQSNTTPLSGLVRCGECGASMSVFLSRKSNRPDKGYYSYFRCIKKVQQAACDNRGVRADQLENSVVEYISYLVNNKDHLNEVLKRSTEADSQIEDLVSEKNRMRKRLNSIDNEISNLMNALSKNILPEEIIMKKYKELETEKNTLTGDYNSVVGRMTHATNYKLNTELFIESLKQFNPDTYIKLSLDTKKALLRSIVKKVLVYKDCFKIHLFIDLDYGNRVVCPHTDKDSCSKPS